MTSTRYPGPKPFTSDDRSLFFGREEETGRLNSIVASNRLTVLFGRSGYGKSSLIQAGVIPYFQQQMGYKVLQVRFVNPGSSSMALSRQLRSEVEKCKDPGPLFLEELKGEGAPSLWQVFKTLQWQVFQAAETAGKSNTKSREQKKCGVLFILDQFEEIFNFGKEDYGSFLNELAELVHNRMPERFQENLSKRMEEMKYYEDNREAIDFIQSEVHTTFLIGIRSDRMFLLDELGEIIPGILSNRCSIGPLGLAKLDRIIRQPALAEGDYASPTFTYSGDFIEALKRHLSGADTGKQINDHIEGFELQIICQFIENRVIEAFRQIVSTASRQVIAVPRQVTERPKDKPADIPPDAPLLEVNSTLIPESFSSIIENYYVRVLSADKEAGFTDFERLTTRFLIERKLIDPKTGNRICLDKTSILPLGFNDAILRKVMETRLVRKELNTVSGESFELSHDILANAILKAVNGDKLTDLDEEISAYYNETVKKFPENRLLFPARSIERRLVNEQGNMVKLDGNDVSDKPSLHNKLMALYEKKIVREEQPGNNMYILNEVFQDKVITIVNKNNLFMRRRISMGLIISVALLIVIAFLTTRALSISARENALRVATVNNVRETDDSLSQQMLYLFNDVYDIVSRTDDSLVKKNLQEKLVNQFNTLFPYADTLREDSTADVNYTLSSDDSLILAVNSVPSLVRGPRPVVTAALFDRKGQLKRTFRDVNGISLFGGNRIAVSRNDSLRIYLLKRREGQRDTIVRENNVPLNTEKIYRSIRRTWLNRTDSLSGKVRLRDLKAIRYLDKDQLLASFTIAWDIWDERTFFMDRQRITMICANSLGIIDLRTGAVSPVWGFDSNDLYREVTLSFYSQQRNFPRHYISDSSHAAMTLSIAGNEGHYLERTDLSGAGGKPEKIRIPAGFFPVSLAGPVINTDYVLLSTNDYSGDNFLIPLYPDTNSTRAGTTLRKLYFSGKKTKDITIRDPLINIQQNPDNTITLITRDYIRILNEDLVEVTRCPLSADLSTSVKKTAYAPRTGETIYNASDALLRLIGNGKLKEKKFNSRISDLGFSSTGDSIFCSTFGDSISCRVDQTEVLHILNRDLEEVFTCRYFSPLACNKLKSVFFAHKNKKLYIIDLSSPKVKFHNQEPVAISEWLRSFKGDPHLTGEQRKQWKLMERGTMQQLLHLIYEPGK